MKESAKKEILEKAKNWWREEIVSSHIKNTKKLTNLDELTLNPFAWAYLSYYLEGNVKAESLAKVLVYPRILGTSFTTSFGTRSQQMITRLFSGISGSTTPGIDIEFIDELDGRKKYCQTKAGPNVINKDDVKTIKDHFKAVLNLARTNNLDVRQTDLMFCLLYGEEVEKSTFVRMVEEDYPVVIGQEFWHRFTGSASFYFELIDALAEVAKETNSKSLVEGVIKDLSEEIKTKYPNIVED